MEDSEGKEPETRKQALSGPSKQSGKGKWSHSVHCNDAWELLELPKDQKAVGSKWVFKIKTDADGSVERYKARLVVQGYTQKFGVDYDARTLVALAAQQGLKLHQMDVTCAFLNGELEEEIYMKQPEGFENISLQITEEYIWPQTISKMLEHYSECKIGKDEIFSNKRRSMHLHSTAYITSW